MTTSVIPLPFKGDLIDYLELHGRKLEWLWRDHEAYVPVRPICDQLNIDWKSQHRKLSAPDYEGCVVMMTTQDTIGRDQEMVCIAYPDFLIWLATLTISKVKPQAQEALRRTKAEIKQVLSAYYRQRLLGEAAEWRKADMAFEEAWIGLRRHRTTMVRMIRQGLPFADIMQTTSLPAWKIAEDIRQGHALGIIASVPKGLPARRVILTPEPANDPRQLGLFANV